VELMAKGDGWQTYDVLSEWTQLLLPRWRSASARCHNLLCARLQPMMAIPFDARWLTLERDLDTTGILSSNSARRRFAEWILEGQSVPLARSATRGLAAPWPIKPASELRTRSREEA